MPRTTKGSKGTYVEPPADVLDAMRELAKLNQRSFKDEVTSAFRRHLATPPKVVLVEGPELAEETVEVARGKPKRGARAKGRA